MNNDTDIESFGPGRMSPLIRGLTLLLLALPVVFLVGALAGNRVLGPVTVLLVATYAWVWLRWRPSRFVVRPDGLEVIWPLRRVFVPRRDIASVRLLDGEALKSEMGRAVRIGVGGLWGAFGWLWTRRRGMVEIHATRTDGVVWIERTGAKPWLITPERPEAFVRALSR